jgi:hypothetical protein
MLRQHPYSSPVMKKPHIRACGFLELDECGTMTAVWNGATSDDRIN